MDAVSVFGFMSAFVTCVLVGYRRHLRTRLPVIAVSIGCCAMYGFLEGIWPLGSVLTLMTFIELRNRRSEFRVSSVAYSALREVPIRNSIRCESRMTRMFGSA